MPKIFHQPLRMCISCRTRELQESLVRLQYLQSELTHYSGIGRSFYICKMCLKDEKKIIKSLMRQCKTSNKEQFVSILKEIIVDE